MSKLTKPQTAISKSEIDELIEQLTGERDKFIERANAQILAVTSQIDILKSLFAKPTNDAQDVQTEAAVE